ncbi:5'-3' exonuclease H3TH domain-containing protein [Massilia sp. W12]|uniref:5'-3' exonuclease H3TH domain-containing protein n=1 Tax=Massilia sp. W12 TaxID=3126507 RepID=UPI0030D27B10
MKLLVIDGPAIVRRVWEASSEDGPGRSHTVLRHCLQSFRKILHAHNPSHALVLFDGAAGGWRAQIHPAYGRHTLAPEMHSALPELLLMLQDEGLMYCRQDDAEVMDLAATVVTRWLGSARGEAVLATNQRILHSLIASGALVWDHFGQQMRDAAWVEQKWGVRPEQVPAWLALVGDSGEGVPGVPKIGAKTAARLLQAYGDIDGVLNGAGILPDATGQALRRARAELELSCRLMQLKTDLVLGLTWNQLRLAQFAHGATVPGYGE